MDAAMAQFLITPLGIEEKNVRTIRDACRGNHPWVIFPIQHRPVADLLTRDGRGASQSKWPSLPELLTLWIRSHRRGQGFRCGSAERLGVGHPLGQARDHCPTRRRTAAPDHL